MKVRLYPLGPDGPEWEASVRDAEEAVVAAGGSVERFYVNVEALKDVLEYAPYHYGRPFLEENDDRRVATTRDDAEGYRLVLFFRLERGRSERLWLMVEWLEGDSN